MGDLSVHKRFPNELNPLLLQICSLLQQQLGYLPNAQVERLTAGTPFQTTTLKVQ